MAVGQDNVGGGGTVIDQQPQVQTEPDDGLNAEERAQFEQMRQESPPAEVVPADGEAKPEPVEGDKPAPALAAEADDDGDDDAEDAAAKDGHTPKRVRYGKHKRVLDENETLKAQIKERDERQARLDERLAIINEALTPKPEKAAPKEEEDPEPDPDEDFVAHAKWLGRQLGKTQAKVTEYEGYLRDQAAAEQITSAFTEDATAFAQREPTFLHAYNYLLSNRAAELSVQMFNKDITAPDTKLTKQETARLRQAVSEEERSMVAGAFSAGQSPSMMVFRLARQRGFDPAKVQAAKPAAEEKPAAANGAVKPAAGLAAEAAALANGKEPAKQNGSVAEEIDRVKRGVDASVSLSQGGGAPAIALTPQTLADMPQDQFNELVERLSPAQLRVAMGG